MADFTRRDDGAFVITEHNCAVLNVARRYGHACGSELQFLQDAMPEATVVRTAHRLASGHICAYEVNRSMSSRFTELVIDSHEPRKLAEFWCAVLGYTTPEEDDEVVEIGAGHPTAEGIRKATVPPTIVFVPVPESKTVKDRIHIDVSPIDSDQPTEVARLISLGARHVDIGQGDQSWVVLADPEGNEFCVLRSLA